MNTFAVKAIVLFYVTVLCLDMALVAESRAVFSKNALLAQQKREPIEQPDRPLTFKNKQDLMKYIKKVNEYYAIAGRPRFGKRSGGDLVDSTESTTAEDELTRDEANLIVLETLVSIIRNGQYRPAEPYDSFELN
jgi:hypothetical protein